MFGHERQIERRALALSRRGRALTPSYAAVIWHLIPTFERVLTMRTTAEGCRVVEYRWRVPQQYHV